jgi:hypothetical protein
MPTHGAPLWEPVAECVAYWDDTPVSVPELVFGPAPGLVAQRTFQAVFSEPLPWARVPSFAWLEPSRDT